MVCHQYFHANPLEFVEWTKQRLGERDFELLQAQERIIAKPDRKLLTMYYQNKIKLLEKSA
jgi:lipopolysaccharide biosynthesis glycosyltransferase